MFARSASACFVMCRAASFRHIPVTRGHRFITTEARRGGTPAAVAVDFGAPDGTPITNKDTILRDVDAVLGSPPGRPPDLEVILADHISYTGNGFMRLLHLGCLRFGHVAVKYTMRDGRERTMNILGGQALLRPGGRMVNFMKPADYLFGTAGFDTYCQQGGVYNRDMIGVRVERVSEGVIDALNAYYEALNTRSEIIVDDLIKVQKYRRRGDRFAQPSGLRIDETTAETDIVVGPGGIGRGAARFSFEGRARTIMTNLGLMYSIELIYGLVMTLLLDLKRRASLLSEAAAQALYAYNSNIISKGQQLADKGQRAARNVARAAEAATQSKAVRAASAAGQVAAKKVQTVAVEAATSPAVTGAVTASRAAVDNAWQQVRQATYQTGNCAQWTSEGLVFAGVISTTRSFPKSILVELLESESLLHRRSGNVKVVVYSQVKHATALRDPSYKFLAPAYCHPLHWVRNWLYSDMRPYADAIVEVPEGSMEARVVVPEATPRRPPAWLAAWQALVMGAPAAVLVGAVHQVGPLGPAAAATWLALNWWLH